MPRGGRTQRCPCGIGIGDRVQAELPLAVVTQPTRLQNGRRADRGQRLIQHLAGIHRHERGRLQATVAKHGLFGQAILRDGQGLRRGEHRHALGQPMRGFRGHILEIEGDHVDFRGKRFQRGVIGPVGHHQRRHLTGAGIGDAVHDQGLHAQRRRGQGQHAGQLTAAKNAQHGLPISGHWRGSG